MVAKLIMSGVPSGSARPVSPSLVDDDDYNADMQDAIMQSQTTTMTTTTKTAMCRCRVTTG